MFFREARLRTRFRIDFRTIFRPKIDCLRLSFWRRFSIDLSFVFRYVFDRFVDRLWCRRSHDRFSPNLDFYRCQRCFFEFFRSCACSIEAKIDRRNERKSNAKSTKNDANEGSKNQQKINRKLDRKKDRKSSRKSRPRASKIEPRDRPGGRNSRLRRPS